MDGLYISVVVKRARRTFGFCLPNRSVAVRAAVSVMALAGAAYAQPRIEVFPVTDPNGNNREPDVSGTTYVWQSGDANAPYIRMWTEGDPDPLTISTARYSNSPHISNGRVVWAFSNRSDFDIALWSQGETTLLTDRDHSVMARGDGGDQRVEQGEPPAVSAVRVPDAGYVQDVNVGLVIPHERVGDVRVTLEHRGVRVVLVD